MAQHDRDRGRRHVVDLGGEGGHHALQFAYVGGVAALLPMASNSSKKSTHGLVRA